MQFHHECRIQRPCAGVGDQRCLFSVCLRAVWMPISTCCIVGSSLPQQLTPRCRNIFHLDKALLPACRALQRLHERLPSSFVLIVKQRRAPHAVDLDHVAHVDHEVEDLVHRASQLADGT
eukprot:6578162-Prymnesium_polylepis.3